MNTIFKRITLAATLLATVVATTVPASADEYYHRRHHGNNGGDALAAGAVGLIAGALIGGALAQPPRPRRVYIDPPVYQEPQPVYGGGYYNDDPYAQPRRVYTDPYADNGYYQQPRVIIRRQVYRPVAPVQVYRAPAYSSYGGLEPWSPEWFDYCSQRYRSFNPQTGTFRGNSGRLYFCTAG